MVHDYQQYQLTLFATLVRWVSVVTAIAVLINSYFFLVDFWPTLVQNGLALAVIAVGIVCLRWARSGRPELAIPLYLTAMMLMPGYFIPSRQIQRRLIQFIPLPQQVTQPNMHISSGRH